MPAGSGYPRLRARRVASCFEHFGDAIVVPRLVEEVVGAALHAAFAICRGRKVRQHDHRDSRPIRQSPQGSQDIEAMTGLELQIQNDDVARHALQRVDGVGGGVRVADDGHIVQGGNGLDQALADQRRVFDQQHSQRMLRGAPLRFERLAVCDEGHRSSPESTTRWCQSCASVAIRSISATLIELSAVVLHRAADLRTSVCRTYMSVSSLPHSWQLVQVAQSA